MMDSLHHIIKLVGYHWNPYQGSGMVGGLRMTAISEPEVPNPSRQACWLCLTYLVQAIYAPVCQEHFSLGMPKDIVLRCPIHNLIISQHPSEHVVYKLACIKHSLRLGSFCTLLP